MTKTPHFLDCTCQCEYKLLLLQARLTNCSKLSVSKRSFLFIEVGGQGPKPSHDTVQYDEYQCIGVGVMESLKANIGDLFIDKTPGYNTLYAKMSATEWKKWPGPLSIGTNALRHPLYHNYVLWCHPSTRTISWFFDLLINKAYHDGSAHDIIYAILEERREGEAKQTSKRKNHPSEGQEVAFRKRLKGTRTVSHNDSQVVTTAHSTPQTTSLDPTSGPLETIVRLSQEAIRLQNDHAALQKLVTTTHPTPSLPFSDRSLSSVSNLLDTPRKSPHSPAILPLGKVTVSKPGLGLSSPKPLGSDVILCPSPQCKIDESDRNLKNSLATATVDSSESTDTVLTAPDPEDANVNASSSVYITDLINHDKFNEPHAIIADVTRQAHTLDTYNSLAAPVSETDIKLSSSGVDLVTSDEPGCIDTGNFVETVARGGLSPVPISYEPLEQAAPNNQSVDTPIGGISEGGSHDTTGAFYLDDNALTMADSDKIPHGMTCNQPFPQSTDPPPTTPDPVAKKGLVSESALSVEQNFRLNCSLKEIIFHVSRNSTLICRLCLGTGAESIRSFSMDVPLEDLGDHCFKEHFQFCEVLRELSDEEVDEFKQHFLH